MVGTEHTVTSSLPAGWTIDSRGLARPPSQAPINSNVNSTAPPSVVLQTKTPEQKFSGAVSSSNQPSINANYTYNPITKEWVTIPVAKGTGGNVAYLNTYDVQTGTYTNAQGNKMSTASVPQGTILLNATPEQQAEYEGQTAMQKQGGGVYLSGQGYLTSRLSPPSIVPQTTSTSPVNYLSVNQNGFFQQLGKIEANKPGTVLFQNPVKIGSGFESPEILKQRSIEVTNTAKTGYAISYANAYQDYLTQLQKIANTPQPPQVNLMNLTNGTFNPKISQQDFQTQTTFQPKPQTLDLITPFQGVPGALYESFIGQPLQIRNELFPEAQNFRFGQLNGPNPLVVLGESIAAGGVYIGSGVVYPFLHPDEFFSSMANKPIESLATMGAFAIAGGIINPETGLFTKTVFTPLKAVATETQEGLSVISQMRANTKGLIGRSFEITSDLTLREIEPEGLFKGSPYLKIKGPIERMQLPEQAGFNYLRLGVGESTLLLPESIFETPKPVGDGFELVVKGNDLTKIRSGYGSGGTGNVFNVPESPGQPFYVESGGVTRVREVGLLERLKESIGIPKQLDYTSQVEAAQLAGIKFGTTKPIEGISFGIVRPREISYPGEFEGFDFASGGFKQPELDITRLTETKIKLLMEKSGLEKPTSYEIGDYFGKVNFESEFDKQTNMNFGLSGSKGTITLVDIIKENKPIKVPHYSKLFDEFSPGGKLFKDGFVELSNEVETRISSGQRQFKTQDITSTIGDITRKASRIKVEGYPFEIKVLYREQALEEFTSNTVEGKQFFKKVTQKKLSEGKQFQPLKSLGESKQLFLPKEEFNPPSVPDNVLDNVFKQMGENKTKPLTKSDFEKLGAIGANISANKGIAIATQIFEKTGTKTSGGLIVDNVVKNLGRTKTATGLLIKPETKFGTKTIEQSKTVTTIKPKLGISAQFESFSKAQTIYSNLVNQAQAQNQVQSQLQKQGQGQAQLLKQIQGKAQNQVQEQNQIQGQNQGQIQGQAQGQGQAQTQAQAQTRTQTQTSTSVGFGFYVPDIPNPRINFKTQNEDDKKNKSLKKLIQGFIPQIRKKGKFVNVGNEILPENKALVKAANVARNTLTRSITLKPAGQIETDEDFINANLNDFRQRKPNSKIQGFPVFVQKNALSSRSETQEIQQAKANKHLNKMLGRF